MLQRAVRSDSLFRQKPGRSITGNLRLYIIRILRFLRENLQNLVISAPDRRTAPAVLNVELGQTKQRGERIAQIDVLERFKVRARMRALRQSREHRPGTFTQAGRERHRDQYRSTGFNGEFDVDLRFHR